MNRDPSRRILLPQRPAISRSQGVCGHTRRTARSSQGPTARRAGGVLPKSLTRFLKERNEWKCCLILSYMRFSVLSVDTASWTCSLNPKPRLWFQVKQVRVMSQLAFTLTLSDRKLHCSYATKNRKPSLIWSSLAFAQVWLKKKKCVFRRKLYNLNIVFDTLSFGHGSCSCTHTHTKLGLHVKSSF